MPLERLQKVLARGGIASRRRSEEIISAGRVTVDGQVVTEMGVKVDPETQDIRCDGKRVHSIKRVYYLVNKPLGYVCTNDDPQGRPRAVDLVPDLPENTHTIGRLDADTEGLLILTNDGELTQRVAHPSHGVLKVYEAWVRGAMIPTTLKGLLGGVVIEGRRQQAVAAAILEHQAQTTKVSVTLVEGRNREVRRMLKRLNHPVISLRRVAIGPISDPRLPVGGWRALKGGEIEGLLAASVRASGRASGPQRRPPRPRRPSRRSTSSHRNHHDSA